MAELSGRNVVAGEEPTVLNGLSGLESAFKPRPYQLEMLEESMRRNIIVAMDTGSGKT
ncbi:MAG: Dicer-like protein 2, partial [Alectoria fallacina]